MSTRTTLRPQSVITSGAMAANITSTPTILQSLTSVCYQAVWSASTAVGTLSVQISNNYALDPTGAVHTAGDWSTITVDYNGTPVSSIPVSGASGSATIDGKTGAYATRLVYTAVSGAGTLNATVCGKVS